MHPPEESLPGGEVGALEEGVLQDALHPSQGLDHVRPIVVQVPQLPIMPLVGPPEWVLLQHLTATHLVLLEVCAHAPPLVIGQGVPVLLEQRVDARDAPVPAVLQVFQDSPPVLGKGLLPLEGVLCPDPLGVDELALPGLDVAVQVGDHLVLVVAHARPEVGDAHETVHINRPEVRLWDEHVSHGKHAQASQLFGGVEHHRRKATRHLGVEANLDPGLDLVLTLHQQVQQLLGVHHRFAEVCHQPDQGRVPLVHNLHRGREELVSIWTGHEDLPDPVVEPLHGLIVHPEETLGSPLFGNEAPYLVLQVPDAVLVAELFVGHAALGQDAALKAPHVEEQVGVVLAVHRHKAALPLHRRHGAGQSVLDVPEHRTPPATPPHPFTHVDVVLHETHAGVPGPALLVVVAHNVLIVGVRMFRQVALDQVSGLLGRESGGPEEDVYAVDVARVEAHGVGGLGGHVLEGQEVVGHLGGPRHLGGPLQAQSQQVQHQAVVLHYERRELQAPDDAIRVGVVHVLQGKIDDDVVLGSHVVGNVVVHNETQQSVQQRQIDLLIHLLKARLEHHVALPFRSVPHVLQVGRRPRTLAPLVHEQGWGLGVGRLDPRWEEAPLVRLVPQVLIQVGVRDLLQGFHVVHWDQVAVQVHELDAHLKDKDSHTQCSLGKQVTLDAGKRLVGVVVRLLNESQFFSL
ncbi:unnamed protein product, partial [Ixodes persulcatus]